MVPEIVEGGRPSKFMNILCEHESFEEVVQEAWHSIDDRYKMKSVWA